MHAAAHRRSGKTLPAALVVPEEYGSRVAPVRPVPREETPARPDCRSLSLIRGEWDEAEACGASRYARSSDFCAHGRKVGLSAASSSGFEAARHCSRPGTLRWDIGSDSL